MPWFWRALASVALFGRGVFWLTALFGGVYDVGLGRKHDPGVKSGSTWIPDPFARSPVTAITGATA